MRSYVDQTSGEEITLAAICAAHPNSLIPEGADLAEFGFATPVEAAIPEVPDGHRLVRAKPVLKAGVWHSAWAAVPLTEAEQEAQRLMLVPRSISSRQGQKALRLAGHLQAVREAIAAITDEGEREDAQIEFGASAWEIDNPFLLSMWAQLGGTERELQDLFTLASTL